MTLSFLAIKTALNRLRMTQRIIINQGNPDTLTFEKVEILIRYVISAIAGITDQIPYN